jgi:hypothetical protein
MKPGAVLLLDMTVLAGIVASIPRASRAAAGDAAPPYLLTIPDGYRDWRWISSAHEEGNLHSIGAVLGNDVAIKSYREGKLPFPDGTIIAALHYRHVPSEENNEVFGQAQSFVPGPQRTFSSWSRIQPSTLEPAVGDSDISAQTASRQPRRL